MPQITLSGPQQKVSLLKDVLFSLGIKNFTMGDIISNKKLVGLKNSANAAFNKYFSWDNNRSELEFE